ncbi:MAG TPA: LptF/LptG family permease [Pyrinomonadaceae bacterium]|nr:LptF/LptG family permease [Pyrinomonadaceae bacterium]
MKRIGWLISTYLLRVIVPYFAMAWLLLSVILFVQQASRYSDIFFSANIPTNLVWQLTIALVPNVIAFTCPMAMLVGTIIGLSKMQGDSELVAIRASGVGNLQIAVPIMILGVFLSGFAFLVNLKGVPLAASLVRNVALQTAIKKLESPLEPGVFNTEVAGYTMYVKGGDIETGRWKNIFIYSEDAGNNSVRLITSTQGRVDTSDETTELVLENASASTLPMTPGAGKYISESIGEVRLAIKTKRGDLIDKLQNPELTPEELGLAQLSTYAAGKEGKDRVEAELIWQRRLLLSITPFIFCVLGTVMVLRFNRGGRGRGIAVALAVLIAFYLLSFLGEQLARTGTISVTQGSLIPIIVSAMAILWFNYSRRLDFWSVPVEKIKAAIGGLNRSRSKIQFRNIFVDLTTGLRDFDIVRNLLKNFLLTLSFLTAIFIIFTAFELWKFAGSMDGGIVLLAKYLFYLLPFVYLQLVPSAAMIGVLATYAIKSRQNEIVTWTSAGQSVYRLLVPSFVLMAALGGLNFGLQEILSPRSNRLQDGIRDQLRARGKVEDRSGKYWIASDQRIYSFRTVESASDNVKVDGPQPLTTNGTAAPAVVASDNDRPVFPCSAGCLHDLSIYQFDDNGTALQSVYRAKNAVWERGKISFAGNVEKNYMREGRIETENTIGGEVVEAQDPFLGLRAKPSQLSTGEVKKQIASSESVVERRNLSVALEKKYTTLFLPFIMALFAAPFALSLSRKGNVVTVGYSIGLWLLFTGTNSVFEQLGLNGILSPTLAVWSPLIIFSMFGVYLLTKVRT